MKHISLILTVVCIAWSCRHNHPPVITGITCSPESRSAGTVFTLQADASDPDGNALFYHWSADGGKFTDSASTARTSWKSPVNGAGITYTLTLKVSDGEEEASQQYSILLSEPVFGQVSGYVYHSGCSVPVVQATVTIEEKSAETDSAGYYRLSDIPVGTWALTATKDGYGTQERTVNIMKSVDLKVNLSMVTVTYSSKISGIVKTADSLPVVGAVLTMLNPDRTESGITATSDASGFYLLRYLPFGQRKIRVHKEPTNQFSYGNAELDLHLDQNEYSIDIELDKALLVGQFTDERDGHIYGYKINGDQTWMTDNLAYLPSVSPPKDGNDARAYYYVYDYTGTDTAEAKTTENYRYYGVLYNWPAATISCPMGWHLPESQEFLQLKNFIGPEPGYALKYNSTWNERGNGNNSAGFNGMAAGWRTGTSFLGFGYGTSYWTSSYLGRDICYTWDLSYNDNDFYRGTGNKPEGYSVRCVKNR